MATIARPKTLAEVRDALCQMYSDVMGDPRKAGMAHEGANSLGKCIGAAKVYLEYCAMSRKQPDAEWARFLGEIK